MKEKTPRDQKRSLSASTLEEFNHQHSPAATHNGKEDDHQSNYSGSDVTLQDLDQTIKEGRLDDTLTQDAVTPTQRIGFVDQDGTPLQQ